MRIKYKKYLFFGIFLLLLLSAAAGFRLHRAAQKQNTILLESDAACTHWLDLHGWKTAETAGISETVMPENWQTPAGQEWLSIQHAQGLHPEHYAGKPVTRRTYTVRNGSAECRAALWLCESELAGAEIYDAGTQCMQPVI